VNIRPVLQLSGFTSFGRNLLPEQDVALVEALAQAAAGVGVVDRLARTVNQLPAGIGGNPVRQAALRFDVTHTVLISWVEDSGRWIASGESFAPSPEPLRHVLDNLSPYLTDAGLLSDALGEVWMRDPDTRVAPGACASWWAVAHDGGGVVHSLQTQVGCLLAGSDFVQQGDWLLFLRDPAEAGIYGDVSGCVELPDIAPFSYAGLDSGLTSDLPALLQARKKDLSQAEISLALCAALGTAPWGVTGTVTSCLEIRPGVFRVQIGEVQRLFDLPGHVDQGTYVLAHEPASGEFRLLHHAHAPALDWSTSTVSPAFPFLRGRPADESVRVTAALSGNGAKILELDTEWTSFPIEIFQQRYMTGQEAWNYLGLNEGQSAFTNLYLLGIFALGNNAVILSTRDTTGRLAKFCRALLPCSVTLIQHTIPPENAD